MSIVASHADTNLLRYELDSFFFQKWAFQVYVQIDSFGLEEAQFMLLGHLYFHQLYSHRQVKKVFHEHGVILPIRMRVYSPNIIHL